MLQAMLHGKLTRQEEGMEDLLTSNTFGLMKYLQNQEVLYHFLSLAWNPISNIYLKNWIIDSDLDVQMSFWPTLSSKGCTPCEPDVLINFRYKNETRIIILIEAKYHSSKSSTELENINPPNDQLAREFDNLRVLAKKQGAKCAVIYLTADFSCPESDIKASFREYRKKRRSDPIIFWLSWRMLPDILELEHYLQNPIIQDLKELFLRLDLTMFRCLRLPLPHKTEWSFVVFPEVWNWFVSRITWNFGTNAASWVWNIIPVRCSEFFIFSINIRWDVPSKANELYRWR